MGIDIQSYRIRVGLFNRSKRRHNCNVNGCASFERIFMLLVIVMLNGSKCKRSNNINQRINLGKVLAALAAMQVCGNQFRNAAKISQCESFYKILSALHIGLLLRQRLIHTGLVYVGERRQKRTCNCSINQCGSCDSILLALAIGIIISQALILGGVEMNPGPNNNITGGANGINNKLNR